MGYTSSKIWVIRHVHIDIEIVTLGTGVHIQKNSYAVVIVVMRTHGKIERCPLFAMQFQDISLRTVN